MLFDFEGKQAMLDAQRTNLEVQCQTNPNPNPNPNPNWRINLEVQCQTLADKIRNFKIGTSHFVPKKA